MLQASDLALVQACSFGRCDEVGKVFIKIGNNERLVGQWHLDGTAGDPLIFYGRRFVALLTEVRLISVRLQEQSVTPPVARASIERIRKVCENPNFVGDVELLTITLKSIDAQLTKQQSDFQAKRAAEKASAVLMREELATRAEAMAESKKWKAASDEFAEIITTWKALPRLNKNVETKVWKRIAKARSTFEKNRRTHFAERKKASVAATVSKNLLISQAEELAASLEWESSSKTLAQLTIRWKSAPRADKKTEDKLWQRFSTARDAFFATKRAYDEAMENKARANLPKAEEVVLQIESVQTLNDTRTARSRLIGLLDEFDKVGQLPKSKERDLAKRIKAVQDNLKNQEQIERRRNDPEKSGRASSTADQLRHRMQAVEGAIEKARTQGETALAADLEIQLATQQALLDAAEAVLKEFATSSHP